MDLILSATSLLRALGVPEGSSPSDHPSINTLEELEQCFAFFFNKCAAAERFVASKEVFEVIVKAAVAVENAQVNFVEFFW